jgi:nucleotide-binding universal stress UspA family protein
MPATVIAVAAAWVAIGAVTAALMWRRGHDALSWLLMGFIFGPMAPLFAMEAWRRREAVEVVTPGAVRRDGGPVDVLVGVDGSPRSSSIVREASEVLGTRIGRLAVALVVPLEAGADSDRRAAETLRALSVGLPDVRLEVLHGRPATALLEHTAEGGYDVLVVGARGAGLGTALLGSTARELVGTSKVPVLVIGGGEATA